jgi:hypothetical protein
MLHNMKHDDTTSPDCKRIVDWREVQDERKEKMQKIVLKISWYTRG